ncbi:MAG: LSU m5C1962 methyltransferase RlmI [Candidatus Ozemobacter sibiricus]|uniref:LSU m5C1962 methyltransferase RlmI n=1 Tax=Candidatus Ozemobacter sibiricus TaxID=2268124 RepID=A0A367ZN93_9BACT|nr:MAG: LSU m5C1962 methyltransferase RlmI [Candidatus Ozemobacter sibiricus]
MSPRPLTLKKNREFSLLKGHPWVFREALAGPLPALEMGEEVLVLSHKGTEIGCGYVDPDSSILVRLVEGRAGAPLRQRLADGLRRAVALRQSLFPGDETTAYRLVNGEGDGLPGLVIDRYAEALSVQLYSLGLEPYLDELVALLRTLLPDVRWIWRRNQVKKAATARAGLLHGRSLPTRVRFREAGLLFQTDLEHGQKTGFFLDQRENRQLVRRIARGRRVANVCGYTGGFTVAAIAGGATRTVTVDCAKPALAEAAANLELNGFSGPAHTLQAADMFEFLTAPGESFDLIVLDPPSLARSQAEVPQALRAYHKLNLEACRRLPAGGLLFTASCTGHVHRDAFLDMLGQVASRLRRPLRLLAETHHAPDHPVALAHPEGRYLKGFLLEVGP